MEGMETANVTPDTAADQGSDDQGQETESNPVNLRDTQKDVHGSAKASQSEKNKIKQQIRELGESDMDALITIKVNGQAKKVPLKEAVKISQLEQASHEKMKEAATLKRQFQEFAKQAKENPDVFFEQFGIDADAYTEARLAKMLEQRAMSPEQREAQEMKEKLKHYEERDKKAKEAEENEKKTKEESRIQLQLDQEITEAFKSSGLPKDPFYVQLMAAQMLTAAKQGEDLSAKEAAERVKTRFSTHVNSILKGMDAQAILTFLGDDVRKTIREAELRRVTDKAPPHIDSATSKPGSAPAAESKGNKPKKPVNEREWRQWLSKR